LIRRSPKNRKTVIKKSHDARRFARRFTGDFRNAYFAGRHFRAAPFGRQSPVKRAWNWLTGKSIRKTFDAAHDAFGFQSADVFAGYDFDREPDTKRKAWRFCRLKI
jgi:hypothetical protein